MDFKSSLRQKLNELFQDKDGLVVLRLEDIDLSLIQDKAYTNDFHELILVEEGVLYHFINGQEIVTNSSEICTLEIGNVHEIHDAKGLKGFIIRYKNEFIPAGGLSYKSSFYASFKGYLGDSYVLSLEANEVIICQQLFARLQFEFVRKGDFSVNKGIMQHLLIGLILILERRARIAETERVANTKSDDKIIYHEFVELLEINFAQKHNMTFYANQLGISRRKLSEIIKKFDKKTAKRLHVERIMLEAKRLLAYSNMSLKQIAYHLGFEHAPYFSNRFKEEYGMTPNQYRMNKQQKQ